MAYLEELFKFSLLDCMVSAGVRGPAFWSNRVGQHDELLRRVGQGQLLEAAHVDRELEVGSVDILLQ